MSKLEKLKWNKLVGGKKTNRWKTLIESLYFLVGEKSIIATTTYMQTKEKTFRKHK
jgi:hypothetical protein